MDRKVELQKELDFSELKKQAKEAAIRTLESERFKLISPQGYQRYLRRKVENEYKNRWWVL